MFIHILINQVLINLLLPRPHRKLLSCTENSPGNIIIIMIIVTTLYVREACAVHDTVGQLTATSFDSTWQIKM